VDAAIGAKLTVEVLTGITIFAAVTKVGSAASLNDTTDEDTNAIRHLHY
jgi:hypothetical protein